MKFVVRIIVLTIITIGTLSVLKIVFQKFQGNDTGSFFETEILGTGLNLVGFIIGHNLLYALCIIWALFLRRV